MHDPFARQGRHEAPTDDRFEGMDMNALEAAVIATVDGAAEELRARVAEDGVEEAEAYLSAVRTIANL